MLTVKVAWQRTTASISFEIKLIFFAQIDLPKTVIGLLWSIERSEICIFSTQCKSFEKLINALRSRTSTVYLRSSISNTNDKLCM